ncbi:MAG: hypothetical protein M1832_005486 [Thelocarpon impressellum]|nr:MAG: hypothetical protein M1832_005486 [Thelocarpon impressellum]
MDIPFNRMDEPRLTVPWEEIGELLAREGEDRRVVAPAQTKRSFSELITNDGEPPLDISWEANDTPLFARARRGCPPDSAAQQAPVAGEWTKSHIATSNAEIHSYMGYVRNTTLATSICHQPDLQSNQGIFIEPISLRTSSHLYPMFGECKLSTNNEILIPSHAYWMKSEQYSGGDDHGVAWQWKLAKAIWRGANAGGRNHKDNWASFQRTRFVAMVNGTKVGRIETGEELPVNFKMPSTSSDLHAAKERHLGEWLSTVADAGLVSLLCWPTQPDLSCPYLEPHFDTVDGVPMAEQYKRKYLPDIDGNSFSGRYRAFLLSTSLPIKSTIFQEWHDSRLVAWKHYVPMDARFHDFYGIMEYFVGYDLGHVDPTNRIRGHDAAAERIATAGMKWANKVLRREDMQIYMFRLLLEYARLLDDERVELGYVDDLQPWF